jgi:hypothetical protein
MKGGFNLHLELKNISTGVVGTTDVFLPVNEILDRLRAVKVDGDLEVVSVALSTKDNILVGSGLSNVLNVLSGMYVNLQVFNIAAQCTVNDRTIRLEDVIELFSMYAARGCTDKTHTFTLRDLNTCEVIVQGFHDCLVWCHKVTKLPAHTEELQEPVLDCKIQVDILAEIAKIHELAKKSDIDGILEITNALTYILRK